MAKTTAKSESIDRLPPQNVEAEQSVLGSLLIDQEAIVRVADIIAPPDFYKTIHQDILEAMLDIYEHREPIDVLSLANRLEEKGRLKEVGGKTYLAELANRVPTASNILHYARIVRRKATQRRLIHAAGEITKLGYEDDDDIEKTLDKAETALFEVSQRYLTQNFVPIKNVLSEAFDRIDELHRESGKLRGVSTGFTDLDSILAGLQKSDLVILAARPSVGKTTLALDMARQVAIEEKVPVGIFSLEMSKEQLIDRLLCTQANVELWKMRTGRLTDEDDFARIGNAMGILSEAPIFIDDSAITSVMEMRTKARRLQSEHGLGLIVVDYLQLMEGRSNADNRVQQVAEITRALKGIAKELNVPVLALSQLSRSTEARTPPIPKLADLRESGSIEQDADVVLFIYRDSAYNKQSDRGNITDIIIAKHRNGPTGKVELYFDENRVSFKNLERQQQEQSQPVTPF